MTRERQTDHSPKTAALLALREGRLSDQGRARIERHLKACELCRRHMAAMDLFERLREEAMDMEPEVDWNRMELPLRREARRIARRQRALRTARWALPALAAAAAFAFFWLRDATPSPVASTTRSETSEAPEPVPAPATTPSDAPTFPAPIAQVVAVVGEASARSAPSDPERPLFAGSELLSGEIVQTPPGSSIHVWLREGTAFRLGSDSRLALLSLGDHVLLELQRGEVHSQVAPLTPTQRYEVSNGAQWVVHVRGTRFAVRRLDAALAVDVTEGRVEVTRGGERIAMLEAPSSWLPPASSVSGESATKPSVQLPWIPPGEAPSRWTLLTLPLVEGIEGWEAVGIHAAGAPLQLRHPRGPLTVYALGKGRRRIPLRLQLTGERLRPDAATLEGLADRLRAEPVGHIDPRAFARAVGSLSPALKRCHRRALKEDPSLAERTPVRLVARLRVGRSGMARVQRWRNQKGAPPAIPPSLLSCLSEAISSYPFPRPEGGPVLLDLPIRLDAR